MNKRFEHTEKMGMEPTTNASMEARSRPLSAVRPADSSLRAGVQSRCGTDRPRFPCQEPPKGLRLWIPSGEVPASFTKNKPERGKEIIPSERTFLS